MKNLTKISFSFKDGILKAKVEKNGKIVYQSGITTDVLAKVLSADDLAKVFSAIGEVQSRFTGKMVCVDNKDLPYYTKGKIYDVVDGEYLDDNNDVLAMTSDSPEKEPDADFITIIN